MTTFADLELAAPLLRALTAADHTTPTPIQAQAIPSVLQGRDILGIAQTGTGKTAAFALPVLDHLFKNREPAPRKGCRVLVLSPTRELATQIAESFKLYGRFMQVTVATIFGGVGYRPQIQALQRGVDVLIATPGRLMDHLESGHADLSSTSIFVLDEADQMLDLGFLKPIKIIAEELAEPRQTLFFSATMPKEIATLADAFLDDPVKVSVTPAATTVERINQRVIYIDNGRKTSALADVLSVDGMFRALVFTRTKRGADRVTKQLNALNFQSAAIHGDKSQGQRERALKDFKNSKIQILVATDIAARGIDVDGISHVVNFDLPEVPEAYVHRIGRTGRAGADGNAISFCTPDDYDLLHAIERATRQKIESEDRRADQSEPVPEFSVARKRGPGGKSGGGAGGRNRNRGRGGASGGDRFGDTRGRDGAASAGASRGRKYEGSRNRDGSSDSRGERYNPASSGPGPDAANRRRSPVSEGSARIVDPTKPNRPAHAKTSGRAGGEGAPAHAKRADAKPRQPSERASDGVTGPSRRKPKPRNAGAGARPNSGAGTGSGGKPLQRSAKPDQSRAGRKKRRAEATAAS